jgi:hypothetical protein
MGCCTSRNRKHKWLLACDLRVLFDRVMTFERHYTAALILLTPLTKGTPILLLYHFVNAIAVGSYVKEKYDH